MCRPTQPNVGCHDVSLDHHSFPPNDDSLASSDFDDTALQGAAINEVATDTPADVNDIPHHVVLNTESGP
jgi:hypothetical protein